MGFLNKIKNILFDEEVVEVAVNRDELPEKEKKEVRNNTNTFSRSGIIDHTINDSIPENDVDDDIIKEVVVPKDEEVSFELPKEEPKVERSRFDFDDDFKTQARKFEAPAKPERVYEPRRDYASLIKGNDRLNKEPEVKDYRKIAALNNEDSITHKPFKVTPVISPVYGIVGETEAMAKEYVNIPANPEPIKDSSKPRRFGPVSFNDSPIPSKQHDTIKKVVKETTVEKSYDPEMPVYKETYKVEKKVYHEPVKPVENTIEDIIPEEDDIEISSPDYDSLSEIKTSGVEDAYLNNQIEDAFETTSELESINASDSTYQNNDEIEASTDEIIDSVINDPDDEHIDDTIETDLFNLIDSMYKDSEEEEDE